ncbi:glycosyltransferase [Olivibacter sp. SDN3]|uniref:glycosyltransferase n=1 Tax=Olivibacter sp. SDN3 TaxID=2764720 RepID=UPI0016514BD2|nr:glycosyltransferase [Olivibacter sp. SDN3]QNL51583.1 glycosyltransferase [Olivibacter sp. SDN3]
MKAPKLLLVALRIDITGDGASIYAMNNALAFAVHAQVDIVTLQAPKTDRGQALLKDAGCVVTEVVEELRDKHQERLRLLKRGHNIFHESVHLHQTVLRMLGKRHYDVIVLELYSTYLSDTIKEVAPDAKILLLQHNYEYANHLEYIKYRIANPIKKLLYQAANYRYQSIEHHYVKNADAVIAISERDRALFSGIRGDQEVYVIAPAVTYACQKLSHSANCYNLLFLGMMDWYPNIAGVSQFIQEVFQPLLAGGKNYHLYIVGKNPVKEILDYQSEHITVTGEVADIDQYIQLSDLLVVPNTLGGGVKIKVMEGIQKSIPLLISRESTVGYEGIVDFFTVDQLSDFKKRIQAYPQELAGYQEALTRAQEAIATRVRTNAAVVEQLLSKIHHRLPLKYSVS